MLMRHQPIRRRPLLCVAAPGGTGEDADDIGDAASRSQANEEAQWLPDGFQRPSFDRWRFGGVCPASSVEDRGLWPPFRRLYLGRHYLDVPVY